MATTILGKASPTSVEGATSGNVFGHDVFEAVWEYLWSFGDSTISERIGSTIVHRWSLGDSTILHK